MRQITYTTKNKRITEAKVFNVTLRYIDDVTELQKLKYLMLH